MDDVKPKDFDLLKEAKDRFKEAYDAVSYQYMEAVNDLKFANGEQWPEDLQSARVADDRPCLVINKIPTFADQIIGDIRQNEPGIKIKPVDSKSDPFTAEVISGLIKNIETVSDAEVVYDTAAENIVYCGYGNWRINTEYTSDDQFEQDITIERIKNPFTVYWDPSSQKFDKSDARYCFVTEKMPKDEFGRLYPDASQMPFEGGADKDNYWSDDKSIRIAEYWKKVLVKKTIYLVQKPNDPEIYMTDVKPNPEIVPDWKILKEREVETYKIVWYKLSQAAVLEGPIDWQGKYIPIVQVYGKEIIIEGKSHYRGIVRNAKDSQRLYNYSRSTGAEVISLAPKSPYLVTATMMGNYSKQWDVAHKKNFPYLPFNPDPMVQGMIPKRSEPIAANTGITEQIMMSDQELHDTIGLQLASLGKKSNEKSGRAILARAREGDIASFAFYDNLARAMKYSAKVILDLIPKIYDTARIIRIINPEGENVPVMINRPFVQPQPNGAAIEKIFNLTVGKYDVAISIGPSYTTQRDEAAEALFRLLEFVPPAGPLISDILVKNLDFKGAEELSKRLKFLLPPQLQGGENGPPPPPPPPNPADVIKLRGDAAKVQGQELKNEMTFKELHSPVSEGGE